MLNLMRLASAYVHANALITDIRSKNWVTAYFSLQELLALPEGDEAFDSMVYPYLEALPDGGLSELGPSIQIDPSKDTQYFFKFVSLLTEKQAGFLNPMVRNILKAGASSTKAHQAISSVGADLKRKAILHKSTYKELITSTLNFESFVLNFTLSNKSKNKASLFIVMGYNPGTRNYKHLDVTINSLPPYDKPWNYLEDFGFTSKQIQVLKDEFLSSTLQENIQTFEENFKRLEDFLKLR